MATIADVTEAVYRSRFDDQTSAGATAARKALSDLGAEVVETDEKVKRSGPSWDTVNRRVDENAKLSAATAAANRKLAAELEALRSEAAKNADVAARADEIERRLTAARDAAIAKARQRAEAERQMWASSGATAAAAALAVANDNAGRSLGGLGSKITAFGFQAQDFAVQVQGGTSAMTAFAQQAPQFLGAFGTGGAIAGAVVAAGALAANLLLGSDNSKELQRQGEAAFKSIADAAKTTRDVVKEVNDLFLTSAQRAQAAYTARKEELRLTARAQLDLAVQQQDAVAGDKAKAEADVARLERARAGLMRDLDAASPRNRTGIEGDVREIDGALWTARAAVQGNEQALSRIGARIGQLNDTTKRLDEAPAEPVDVTERNNAKAERDAARADRAADTAAAKAAREAEREYNDTLREREKLVQDNETAYEKYQRRLVEIGEAQDRAAKAGVPLDDETIRRATSALMAEYERAEAKLDGVAAKRAEAAAKQAEDEEKRQQQAFDRTVERYSYDLSKSTVDALMDGTKQGESFFTSLATAFKNALKTAIAGALDTSFVRPLLGDLLSSLGFTGSTGSGGGLSLGGMGSLSSLGSSLGLTGPGGTLSSLGSSLGLSGAGSLLSAPLWTTSVGAAASAALPAGAVGPVLPASALGGMGMGTTAGSLLGGAGLGFGAGMALNSVLGGSQTGGMVGSGAGALAGAAIGSIIPGVGTLIGGLLGGALGGAGGGLFGPTTKGLADRAAGDVIYGVNADGQLVVTGSRGKRVDQEAARKEIQAQLDTINQGAASRGLTFNTGYSGQVGFGKGQSAPKTMDEASLVASLRGGDATVQGVLGRLAAQGKGVNDAFGAVDWIKGTYEPLMQAGKATNQYQASLDALATKYSAAITKAQELGLATEGLAASQAAETAALNAQRNTALNEFDKSLDSRTRAASGTVDALADALDAFDTAARGQLTAAQSLFDQWGVAGEDAAARMVRLEQVQASERLKIQQDYADQAAAAAKAQAETAAGSAASAVASIADYARKLRTGDASPLSAEAQYSSALGSFNAVLGAAMAGDAGSLGRLTGYADDLLSTSRTVYGSGAGYAADFGRVIDALESLGLQSGDTLTASFWASETRTQTATLVDELQALRAEVTALRREQSQQNLRMGVAA